MIVLGFDTGVYKFHLYIDTNGALPFSNAVRKLWSSVVKLFLVRKGNAYEPVVISMLSDVSYPRQSLVSALFNNFEVSDLDT